MEQLANFPAVTTLNMPGDLDSSSVTLTLVSIASPFPTSFPFRIRIDDELMKVTATPGSNQWTVSRADGGTTAASHVNGSTVRAMLTKESLDSLVTIQQSGSEISNRRILNFVGATVTDNSGNNRADVTIPSPTPTSEAAWITPPVVASWTIVNSASISQQGNFIVMANAINGGNNIKIARINAPGVPYTLTARLQLISVWASSGENEHLGLLVMDSTTGKFTSLLLYANIIALINWNSTTSLSSTVTTFLQNGHSPMLWMRIIDDGTNLKFQMSGDGTNWIQITSVTRTSFLATPDRIGFCLDDNGTRPCFAKLLSWQVTTP